MVSTGWRTAATVIIIIIGAALLTFSVYIWRRQKMLRRGAQLPEMQQRFMSSYAGDPEAHMPLLFTANGTPPLPPKTQPTSHQRDRSGDVDEWGFRIRVPPARVPVPPMTMPEPSEAVDVGDKAAGHQRDPEAAIPMPEPSVIHKLFPTPSLLQFPRLQFTRQNTRLGRLPSLRIQFLRESNQVVSSPIYGFPEPDKRASLPASTSSGPSTLSRPFATMATSPLPPLEPVSPISISRSSPSTTGMQPERNDSIAIKTERSDSIASVGHNLFTRKTSTEDASYQAFSRDSSQKSRPSATTVARGNGSASSSSSGVASGSGLRRGTTWTPNVLGNYSHWKGVVQDTWAANVQEQQAEMSMPRVESPTGQIRVADAYRPMPTVSEAPENVVAVALPRPLPQPPAVRPTLTVDTGVAGS
ncbi:hypothetical protein C8Q70DRAFT_263937 [Cubamyces menziesii]|nr:hypothetical protein C8Q70DRAFT_263937 [Cubamyces menziesii]